MLNVVTEPQGTAGAVLFRAIEPIEGIAAMERRRGGAAFRELCSGPGKLTTAFGIDYAYHGRLLTEPPLYFVQPPLAAPVQVGVSTRIGITKGVEMPWRFFEVGNQCVSRGKPSGAL
jgi:DNA-3-methyladenine glycosylase